MKYVLEKDFKKKAEEKGAWFATHGLETDPNKINCEINEEKFKQDPTLSKIVDQEKGIDFSYFDCKVKEENEKANIQQENIDQKFENVMKKNF